MAVGRSSAVRRPCHGATMPVVYNVRVKLRWWVMPYLRVCRLAAWAGIQVNLERVKANVMRGVSRAYTNRGPFRPFPQSG